MQHPKTLSDINAAWITEILRGSGVVQQSSVTHADVKAIGEGVGFLSGRARVRLVYDRTEPGAPSSLVVKLPSSVKESMEFAESSHAYEREIRFYREVVPHTPVRVPFMYATIMEPPDIYVLVMEDLGALNIGDQCAGLSRAQVLAGVRAIAPMHAAWWNADRRQALPWVPPIEEQRRELFISAENYRRAWPPFVEEFGRFLPAGGQALGERIGQHLESIFEAFESGPRTLVHFDYRADNMFFDDLTRPDPVVVLDWQLAVWSLGAYDVARLAGGSLPPEERGGHHVAILDQWYKGLLAGGVTDYSHKQAWHDYRLSAIMAALNPVLFHHMFKTGGPRGLRLGAVMTERLFSDLIECGAEAVVP